MNKVLVAPCDMGRRCKTGGGGYAVGNLLRFDKRKLGGKVLPHQPVSGDAQIVIFTGVRYERSAPTPAKSGTATRAKRKRV